MGAQIADVIWSTATRARGEARDHSQWDVASVTGDMPGPALQDGAARIQRLTVSERSSVHIGPEFVTLSHRVHNVRLRPDGGVCALVAAWARRSTRGQRAACAAALLALLTCGALLAAALSRRGAAPPAADVAPHAWNITRAMWLARAAPPAPPLRAPYEPPRLVVVQHTAGPECRRFVDCAATVRHLQDWYIRDYLTDIPYNFLVGNDGRVYEGRGWGAEGAHTLGFNRCSVGLGFVGDYRAGVAGGATPSEAQLARARRLLAFGAARGLLHPRYRVLGALHLQPTASPGDSLLAALQAWPRYALDPERFYETSCEFVYDVLQHEDDPPDTTSPVT